MTTYDLERLVAAWTRLGALFNVAPADQTPDVERLLLRTARAMPGHSRLFPVAVTWLTAYGELVDDSRLARLVRDELEAGDRPAMGLLLESVQAVDPRHRARFAGAVGACEPAAEPGPLFDVDRQSAACAELARQQASPLSRKWGRWANEVELRNDVIRPLDWVLAHNPGLSARASTLPAPVRP